MRRIYLDFEFSHVTEKHPTLVCCATLDAETKETTKFWLHKNLQAHMDLVDHLSAYDTIIAYSAIAECRSLLALGLDPLKFNIVDLFLEYRLASNHNDRLNWGKQLVDGKVRMTKKPLPKWERVEGEDQGLGFKPTHSLAEATFKLTGQIRDTEHKTAMRDLIISAPKEYSADEQRAIVDYCLDDVVFLPDIARALKKEFAVLGQDQTTYIKQAFARGRYAAHTAIMESNGYPVDIAKTKNFSDQVGSILAQCQREINGLFPGVRPFKWNKREGRFSLNEKRVRDWIVASQDEKRWMKTDTGRLSLSLEAWQKNFNFQHDYPTDNFGAQVVRFLKLKQSLYGFSSTGGKRKSFWDAVGTDWRVRPYMNIYGAQSSRSQPAATGFMFLKPAWMRALVVPEPGKFMAGIDYGSQEFFISALEARDQNMIDAYLSGDPYLAFGKIAGVIPRDGTKSTHKRERDLCKATVLGISYLMSKYGLAIKLTNDTGRVWTEDEAQDQIDLFYEAFSDLKEYQEQLVDDYRTDGYMRLPCGWTMWGDNDNHRSVANMRIQGFGASVMRKAVDLCVARGLQIAFTLHDALYIEGPMDKIGEQMQTLRDSMREAFQFYFADDLKQTAGMIRLDPYAWSPDFATKDGITPGEYMWGDLKVPVGDLYLDERSARDYNLFSKYFTNNYSDVFDV